MKRGKILCSILIGCSLLVGGVNYSTINAKADNEIEDNLGSEYNDYNDNGIGDYLKNHKSMTSEQLEKASETVSPITNIFGYLMGGIIALTSGGIFLITAIDLLYIAIPPIRGILYKSEGSSSMGMGGYGMRGQMSQSSGSKFQLVSDEAVLCVNAGAGSSQSMGMGGYGMQGSMQQNAGGKSIISTYLKKRMIFIILFAICTVILTSSILLGTGVNLAKWGMKLIEILNNSIPSL